MMLWRFSRDLYDRRGRGQDPLLGRTSEHSGAAPGVLAHPGEHIEFVRALDVPHDAVLCVKVDVSITVEQAETIKQQLNEVLPGRRVLILAKQMDLIVVRDVEDDSHAHDSAVWEPHGLGLGPSQPEATLQAASRIAEAPYPEAPLASRKAP